MLRCFPRILQVRSRRIARLLQPERVPRKEWSDTSEEDDDGPGQTDQSLVSTTTNLAPDGHTTSISAEVRPDEHQRGMSPVARNVLMIANVSDQHWVTRAASLEEFRGLTTEKDLIQVLQNVTDAKTANRLFKWAARQDSFQHSVFTYNTYLNVLAKAGKHIKLKKGFDDMLAEGVFPNVYTYGTVLRGLCDAGRVDDACELIRDMESKMLTPTSFICNMLISCLCKHGRIEEAYNYFTSMREECAPDRITYNVLTLALCKTDQLDRALAIFSRMESENIQPNLVTYNGFLYGYCKAGQLEQAMDLLKDMIEGKKGSDIVPDKYSYNIVMSGLCKANKLHTARYVLRRMLKHGCLPDVITYNTLLDGLCQARKIDEANEIFQHMLEKGCEPSVVTYTTLIAGNARVQQLNAAREYFVDMLRRGIEPNVYTYTSLIGGLCEANKMDEALEMLKQMTTQGKEPNRVTYTRVISALCKFGQTEKAVQLFRDSMGTLSKCRPDIFAFNTIIFGLCRHNKFLEAYEFFEQMVEMKLVSDLPLYRTLADGLELMDEKVKLTTVCEEANKHGIVLQQLNEDTRPRRKLPQFVKGRELSREWRKATLHGL